MKSFPEQLHGGLYMHFDSMDSRPVTCARNQVEFHLLVRNSSRRDKNKKQREGLRGSRGVQRTRLGCPD